ncbi:cache domain-containing protein [Yoonia sp. BS5-3]|uniref:Cache domain-containing protein n=1 Tax=Yoonia phaeophyticola TaxID=3137369 RepID=A0ABZ2V2D1_9RHOB
MIRMIALAAAFCWAQIGMAAEDRGSSDEAVAMVVDALSVFEEGGRDALIAAISDQSSDRFRDRDLFPIMWNRDGVMLAHGRNSPAVGTNRYDVTDVNGFYHTRALIDVAMNEGAGWVPYRFEDPISGQPADKVTYVLALDDQLLVGVGIYADQ